MRICLSCSSNNYIAIYEVFNARHSGHKITNTGRGSLLDFTCLNLRNPVKEVDITLIMLMSMNDS